MANQGKRMVQEDELKYLQTLKKEHEDPTAPWGGGSDYTAGEGIDITEGVISIDDETVALKTDIPTNYVTTDTDQEITGIKTFTGDKKVRFKQDAAAKRIGFTGFDYNWDGTNTNKNQLGYLEMNNNDQNHNNSPSNILGVYYPTGTPADPYRGKDFALGFEYYKVAGSDTYTHWYSLLVPPCYDGNNITLERYIPIDFKNGNTTVRSDKTGVVDLSSLMPTIPTNVSSFNNDAGYITSSALSGYATETWVGQQGYITGINSSDVITALGYTPGTSNFSGSYNDLTDKPTIPTVTASITQGSTDAVTSGAVYNAIGDIESLLAAI